MIYPIGSSDENESEPNDALGDLGEHKDFSLQTFLIVALFFGLALFFGFLN